MNALSVKRITNLPGTAVGASVSTEKVFKDAEGSDVYLFLPGGSRLANRKITIRAGGRVTGAVTTNFTVKLYLGTTVIEATAATAVDSASHNFFIEATGVLDSSSKKFQGLGKSCLANVIAVEAALDAIVTLTDLNSETLNKFKVSGTFSVADAGNLAILDFFEIVIN